MADEPTKWYDLFLTFLDRPEKGALLLVLLAGCWRWVRELLHANKDYTQHETFTEMLIRENKEQREENARLREELIRLHEKDLHSHHEPVKPTQPPAKPKEPEAQ